MPFKDFLHLRGACGLSGYGIISICFICLCSLLSQASYFGLLRLQWRISEVGGAKIVKTLIIPYFLYQFIYLPILFVSKYGYSDISVLWKLLCGLFLGDGYETAYSIPVCLPCWFIVSIIQLRLLFLLVPINKCTSILGCFSIAFLLLRKIYNFDLLFCLDSTVMAIPYFLLGHYLNTYRDFGKREVFIVWL